MLGILGGTFDPIHYGHLNAAWHGMQTLNLDELRLMPCLNPPHRPQPIANATERVEMLQLAIQNVRGFAIDDRELKNNQISYTVTSLTNIRTEVGNKPICLLLGIDAFNQIHTWHQPEQLMQLAHLIILGRPSQHLNQTDVIQEFMQRQVHDPLKLKSQHAGLIYFEQNALLDISATQIRQMISKGLSPKFLLPDAVLNYIATKKLYYA